MLIIVTLLQNDWLHGLLYYGYDLTSNNNIQQTDLLQNLHK